MFQLPTLCFDDRSTVTQITIIIFYVLGDVENQLNSRSYVDKPIHTSDLIYLAHPVNFASFNNPHLGLERMLSKNVSGNRDRATLSKAYRPLISTLEVGAG